MSFFAVPVTDEYGVTYELTTAGYTALVLVMLAIILVGCAIFGSKRKFNAKQLCFSAMAMALATVASMIKLVPEMPMGGSVTLLSMLFITLIGYWYGLGAGLTTAVAYGILQLITGPYIISFPQMMMDYVFAFGGLGLAGLFSKSKHGLVKGYIAGVLGRYFFATLSGLIFFATYTPDFLNSPILYSLAYNGAYIGLEALITLIVISLPPVSKAMAHVKSIAN